MKIYISNQPKDINYANLERLLSIQDWEGADYETSILMQKITNQSRSPLYRVNNLLTLNQFHQPIIVSKISCKDLLKIDKLWTQYSKNRLVFTPQRAILKPLEPEFKTIEVIKLNQKFRATLKWERYYSAHGEDKERRQRYNKRHYQKVINIPLTEISYGYLPYKLYSDTYYLKIANSWGYYNMPLVITSTVRKVEHCSEK